MLLGLEQISKDVTLRDDDILGLAKRLTEHIRYSAHVSAASIICRLSKCSLGNNSVVSHSRVKEVFVVLGKLAESPDAPVRVTVASNLKVVSS